MFLNEKVKLKIMKYNKSIQKLSNINLINYKLFKKKYVIYDENGIAKEYDIFENKLIYKGEYLNGERNGQGKEYDDNVLLFRGEYLNGKNEMVYIKYIR